MIGFLSENHSISCDEKCLRVDGKEISSTRMERNLLLYFLLHPNRALSREQLLKEVWGYEFPGNSRTVDSHVKKLRRDLGGFGGHIVTVRGVGYRLETGAAVIAREERQCEAS